MKGAQQTIARLIMAAITITAGNVVGSSQEVLTAGASITAGQAIYKDSSGLAQLSDCDSAAAAKTVYGVALNAAAAGQPLSVQRTGSITIGGTVVVGMVYILDGGAGGICPITDLASGDTVCIIGYATTTGILTLDITNTGIAYAP